VMERGNSDLYLNSLLVHPALLVPPSCAFKILLRNVQTVPPFYGLEYVLPAGLSLSTPTFSQVSFAPFYDSVGALLVSLGWTRGVNYFIGWYDTSVSPVGQMALSPNLYDNMYDLINGFSEATVLVSHSSGCFHVYWFLVNYNTGLITESWKADYIHEWVMTGNPMAGLIQTPFTQYALLNNLTDITDVTSWSSLALFLNEMGSWFWPDPLAYGSADLWDFTGSWSNLLGISSINLNAGGGSTARTLFNTTWRYNGERSYYDNWGTQYTGVRTKSFCGTNISTPIQYDFSNSSEVTASVLTRMNGDGMIGFDFCSFYPTQWAQYEVDNSLPAITRVEIINGVHHDELQENIGVLLSWLPDALSLVNNIDLIG